MSTPDETAALAAAFLAGNLAVGPYAAHDTTTQHHVIALGEFAQALRDYELAIVFAGIGQRQTILTPEEHAVCKGVFLRMFAQDIANHGTPNAAQWDQDFGTWLKGKVAGK